MANEKWLAATMDALKCREGIGTAQAFKFKAWKHTDGSTVWKKVFCCAYSRTADVACGWRGQHEVTGETRVKGHALLGAHTIKVGDIPHSNHDALSSGRKVRARPTARASRRQCVVLLHTLTAPPAPTPRAPGRHTSWA